jgi:hypothetical protein
MSLLRRGWVPVLPASEESEPTGAVRPGAIRRRPLQYVSGPGDAARADCRAELLAGERVNGDDVELDRHLLDPLVRGVLGDQAAQARLGHEMIARSEEPSKTLERTEWKDLPAPNAASDLGQLVGRLDSPGM